MVWMQKLPLTSGFKAIALISAVRRISSQVLEGAPARSGNLRLAMDQQKSPLVTLVNIPHTDQNNQPLVGRPAKLGGICSIDLSQFEKLGGYPVLGHHGLANLQL